MSIGTDAQNSTFIDFPIDRRRLLIGLTAAGAAWAARQAQPRIAPAMTPTAPYATPSAGGYDELRDQYTRQARLHAFATDSDSWEPELGFAASRPFLAQLYGYYGDLYLRSDAFLWAGLARLAGASVIGGLDALVRAPFPNYPDPSVLTRGVVGIARAVFLDLGWQHEAFLDDPELAIALGAEHDVLVPAQVSYAAAWSEIAAGGESPVANGNLSLLEIEQFSIVQPFYDRILADPAAGPVLRQTGGSARRVHPYHRDFAQSIPAGDLSDPDQRWRWISEPGGMWEAWVTLPSEERRRLVELPLEDLIAQAWGAVIEEFIPAEA